jgi:hypothetical protein
MMSDTDRQPRRAEEAPSPRLHPRIYLIMLALAVLLVVSIWGGFFGTGAYDTISVAAASLFVAMAVLLPYQLWRVALRRRMPEERRSFAAWLAGDFETGSDRVKAAIAAVEVLLPLSAVAIAMMAFALAAHFDRLAMG